MVFVITVAARQLPGAYESMFLENNKKISLKLHSLPYYLRVQVGNVSEKHK